MNITSPALDSLPIPELTKGKTGGKQRIRLEDHYPVSSELLFRNGLSHPGNSSMGGRDVPRYFCTPAPKYRLWSPAYSPRCLNKR